MNAFKQYLDNGIADQVIDLTQRKTKYQECFIFIYSFYSSLSLLLVYHRLTYFYI